jgi:hypothetical protein
MTSVGKRYEHESDYDIHHESQGHRLDEIA